MDKRDYVTFTEARQMLGSASKDRLRRIVTREGWTVYNSPRDAREKWLLRSDVERFMQPRPMPRKEPPDER